MAVSFKTHRIGRHLLIFGDGGSDHCRRCGEVSHYLQDVELDGSNRLTVVPCDAVPKKERWWPQRPPRPPQKPQQAEKPTAVIRTYSSEKLIVTPTTETAHFFSYKPVDSVDLVQVTHRGTGFSVWTPCAQSKADEIMEALENCGADWEFTDHESEAAKAAIPIGVRTVMALQAA